jgi:predicted lipid-binding transport protein (Tim44 family)
LQADILLYGLVAAGLIFWLRSILGTRHGDERERPNPFTSQPNDGVESQTHSKKPHEDSISPNIIESNTMSMGLGRNMSIENELADQGLLEITKYDRSFDVAHFLTGAQDAFIMIVEAFADGDRETLNRFLSSPVFDAFNKSITDREEKEQRSSMEIHSIRKTEILEAYIKDKVAYVTVKFIADETNVLRDKDDNIIFGDPDRVTETIDIWTFSRDTRSRDPSWVLCATRDEDAADQEDKTVPDS